MHPQSLVDMKELQRQREDDEACQIYRSATQAASSMKRTIETLAPVATKDGVTADLHVQHLLDRLSTNLEHQEAAHRALLERIQPVSRKPPGASDVVAKVFGMLEILEQILLYLSTHDICWNYGVSRTFRDTIEDSIRLQRKLGLAPDLGSYLRIPLESFAVRIRGICLPAFETYFDRSLKWAGVNEVMFDIAIITGRGYEPGFSPRAAAMLLCQPPAKEVKVIANCCQANITLCSEGGVTWGETWEAVAKLRDDHFLCPSTTLHWHDWNGYQKFKADLELVVRLKSDDPTLIDLNKYRLKQSAQKQRSLAKEARMAPYIAAKRAARDHGQAMPTLAEFEERQETEQV